MNKIAIISEFNMNTVNFGNRLQSFALNRYLMYKHTNIQIEYLYFSCYPKPLVTKKQNVFEQVTRIKRGLIRRISMNGRSYKGIEDRIKMHNHFSERNMTLCDYAYTWEELQSSDFDAIIVGSDVVWAQGKYSIQRLKFLDFEARKPFVRIAYSASLGRDWIPEENVPDVKRCLDKFQAISVRESSSVEFLRKIGIEAVHTLDPTLLLDVDEWSSMEEKPATPYDKYLIEDGYIFTYLLGTDSDMRQAIMDWAHSNQYLIVTVPYASGLWNKVDKKYGDIQLMNCSPENWLWLVHHARYVVTDSFHGTIFSTIFKRCFVVLERKMTENINNRMIDFLKTIHQSDKMIPYTELDSVQNMKWDYDEIDPLISEKREFSEKYLSDALKMVDEWKISGDGK